MISMKIKPTDHTYLSIIPTFGKAKRKEDLLKYLQLMRGSPPKITKTYNAILEAKGNCGVIGTLEEILKEMNHWNLEPNDYTWRTLLKCFEKSEHLKEEYQKTLDLMKVRNIEIQIEPELDMDDKEEK